MSTDRPARGARVANSPPANCVRIYGRTHAKQREGPVDVISRADLYGAHRSQMDGHKTVRSGALRGSN